MWRENAPKVLVLFSGGVESTCLLYLYLKKGALVYPAYVKAGYPWERLELQKATELWQEARRTFPNLMTMRVINIPNSERVDRRDHRKDLFIPLRNLTLITSAGNFALSKGIDSIAIGSLGIYPFPDNNADFMNEVQSLTGLRILAPFMGMEKHEVIKKFSKNVPLEKTISCINPRKSGSQILPCGHCEKCKEREDALRHLLL